ncbi:alpha/beta hydrolase-fold protein [Sphingomicrobium arenosum]|uniref:alpha/beta hydrolase-fold protein n=1 Tax=Sphingomicrobium arenosum TaxID=2233861 RepID=UPI002240CD4B|nr:alpha/beta hydrolase-fold protein [Sphingomicrobium arenosum]
MTYRAMLAAATMSLAAPALAEPMANDGQVGEIHEITIPAPSLAGNLLGTPTTQKAQIYLPPSYESDPERRYPVIYLLHGFHGTDRTWMKDLDAPERVRFPDSPYQDYGLITAEWLAAKFEHDAIPEMIIVAPNGRNIFKHGFWMNGEVIGNWSDYVARDVVGHIDAHYRTLPQRESRGIAGHSGGGHGSIRIAMLHPDIFNSVYAMAPCCLGGGADSLTADLPTHAAGEVTGLARDVYATVDALETADDLPGSRGDRPHDFNVNAEVATAAVYSPNPDNPPFYSDFAFDRVGDAFVIDEAVLERRAQRFAINQSDAHFEALRSLDGLFIDTGELEYETLREGAGAFVAKLAEHQVPVRFDIYADGNHGNLFVPRFMTLGLDYFTAHLATEMASPDASLSSAD